MIYNHTGYIITRESVELLLRELDRIQSSSRKVESCEVTLKAKNGTRLEARVTRYGVVTLV